MTVIELHREQAAEKSSSLTWADRARQAELLALAASGHRLAFARFYDETSATTYALELRRWEDRELAELVTQARYVAAWTRAADHAGSGLSPLAWLLSLELGRSA